MKPGSRSALDWDKDQYQSGENSGTSRIPKKVRKTKVKAKGLFPPVSDEEEDSVTENHYRKKTQSLPYSDDDSDTEKEICVDTPMYNNSIARTAVLKVTKVNNNKHNTSFNSNTCSNSSTNNVDNNASASTNSSININPNNISTADSNNNVGNNTSASASTSANNNTNVNPNNISTNNPNRNRNISNDGDTNSNINTLPSYDFSFSGRREWLPLEKHQPVKFFTLRRVGEGAAGNTPIQVERDNLSGMLKAICTKNKRVKEKNLRIHYVIRNKDGTGTPMTLCTDIEQEQLKRDLETFYIQAEDMSFIEFEPVAKEKKRASRESEDLFHIFKKEHAITQRTYTEFFTENDAREFLRKRKLIQLIYGKEHCVNLVNHGRYFCHVPGCPKPGVWLKTFNNTSTIDDHWSDHTDGISKTYQKDSSCELLLKRKNYAVGMAQENLDVMIQKLENAKDSSGNPLGVMGILDNKNVVLKGSAFSEKDMVIDEEVIKKMLDGKADALDGVPKIAEKKSFFKPRSSKS